MLAVMYSLLKMYSNDTYSYWNISKNHLLKGNTHEVNGRIMVNINFFLLLPLTVKNYVCTLDFKPMFAGVFRKQQPEPDFPENKHFKDSKKVLLGDYSTAGWVQVSTLGQTALSIVHTYAYTQQF